MLVKRSEFSAAIEKLSFAGFRGLDTESTGLTEKDRLFCITIFGPDGSFYFNFQDYPNIDRNDVLPLEWAHQLNYALSNTDSVWFIHNAKHDLKFLKFAGIEIGGTVICTEVQERVFRNNYFSSKPYSLASCASRRGLAKDEEVDQYISDNKLYDNISIPGKKKQVQLKHFDKVPFEIISKRAVGDAKLHYEIGIDQVAKINTLGIEDDELPISPTIKDVSITEIALTKVCFAMERDGMKINKEYTREALCREESLARAAQKDFEEATGIEFSDGRKCLVDAFTKLGEPFPTTEKGNPSFRAEVLEDMETPVANMVNRIRKHQKIISTYYSSFLYFAGEDSIIHPNIRQGGTETGRFSYSDPNLQNVPKEDQEKDKAKPFFVRSCFVPKYEGTPLLSMDYEQQEFRMMIDYAGEMDLIKAVNDGADVHQATADIIGSSRTYAKTTNFGILYGMGNEKLARRLGKTLKETKEFKDHYFGRLPKVRRLMRQVANIGSSRGYIRNWAGRRCYLEDSNFDYILINHLIQGGCADTIKKAMVRIKEHFDTKRMKTEMNLQVHDELVFNWFLNEIDETLEVKKIMESVYIPRNGIKMTCSIDHSFKSWGYFDKVKGLP